MKLIINFDILYNQGYYIMIELNSVNRISIDIEIAAELNIIWEKYVEILLNYNAHQDSDPLFSYYYFFKNKKDAEECIKFLTPYLIMKILTK